MATKIKVTRVSGISESLESNIRITGGPTLGTDIGNFLNGQVGYGVEELGGPDQAYWCVKLNEGNASPMGWVYARWNHKPTYLAFERVEDSTVPPTPTEKTTVEFIVLGDTEVYITPPNGTKTKVWPQA